MPTARGARNFYDDSHDVIKQEKGVALLETSKVHNSDNLTVLTFGRLKFLPKGNAFTKSDPTYFSA